MDCHYKKRSECVEGRGMDVSKSEEACCEVDLVEGAFLYLTESKYPVKCTDIRKRAIRKKAKMFVIRDGVMYFKKKKKGQVGVSSITL